ncbi:hypothetical protein KJ766_01505, partial [Patescibacteria group bacterium]|nr:hypothetical protein [Patescibacteria group bacterium]
RVNELRKKAGMTIRDKIELFIFSESDQVSEMLNEHKNYILDGTLSKNLVFQKSSVQHEGNFRIAEQDIWLGF